jgi:hypothetical protein
MLKWFIPCGDMKIEAHCTKITALKKSRRGCVGKAWVPKRIPWRVSLLAARIISVLLSHFFAKGYHRKGVFLSFLLR